MVASYASVENVYSKISVGFYLDSWKRFFLKGFFLKPTKTP